MYVETLLRAPWLNVSTAEEWFPGNGAQSPLSGHGGIQGGGKRLRGLICSH